MKIFPALYKSYIEKNDKISENCFQASKSKCVLQPHESLFIKKIQFEIIIDRYLPLLQVTNEFFTEKIDFFSFLFDEMMKIALNEFFELINNHLPLVLTDFSKPDASDCPLKNVQHIKRKLIKKINNSISIFDRDLEIVANFFKIPISYKISEIDRQFLLFDLFTKQYRVIQRSFKIDVNSIKSNIVNEQYIKFIKRTISLINIKKEAILLSMMKLFGKDTCPDFHFPMLQFIIANSCFKNEIFSFSEDKCPHSSSNNEADSSIPKSQKLNADNVNNQFTDEMSHLLELNQINDQFSFTKLAYILANQGICDHNDISSLLLVIRKCKRTFSPLSVHKLLQIASSNVVLSRTVLWSIFPPNSSFEGFPDQMFGSPGIVTIIVFFIMRAFEFLIVSSIPNKYRTKQRLTADIILAFYHRACRSLGEIKENEKRSVKEEAMSLSSSASSSFGTIASNVDENASQKVEDVDGESSAKRIKNEIGGNNNKYEEEVKAFTENDDDNSYGSKNITMVCIKRGMMLIKQSIEIGLAMMNMFKARNAELFNNEIIAADLFAIINKIEEASKNEKKEMNETNQSAQKRQNMLFIEMVNIGFTIVNQARFNISDQVFFKHILNELTRIPVQKFDLKNMCSCFEPEFPYKKEFTGSKVFYLRIQNEKFVNKINENEVSIFLCKIAKNDATSLKNEVEKESETVAKDNNDNAKKNNKSNLNSSNLAKKLTQRKNLIFNKKNRARIRSKKENEND